MIKDEKVIIELSSYEAEKLYHILKKAQKNILLDFIPYLVIKSKILLSLRHHRERRSNS